MSFRLRCLGLVVWLIVAFVWVPAIPAQGTTNFAAWKDAKNAESVAEWARRLLIQDFRDVTGTAREELLAETLSKLKDIAADSKVVPPTRYNAVLTAGQLVSKAGSPGTLPEAYPAALTYLLELYQEVDTPHSLKYGALLGIVRHAVCGVDSSRHDQVLDLLLETFITEHSVDEIALDLNTIPLEPAVWDWFRQTALDGIAALKTTGTDGKVVAALLSVIDGKSLELEDLCRSQEILTRTEREQIRRTIELASKAAKTLGDLDYTSATKLDAEAMTDTFVMLTQTVCDVERKMTADATNKGNVSVESAILMEQIVVDLKTCIQSVVWGIRSTTLTGRPAAENPHPFYASLKSDEAGVLPAMKRLDTLMSELTELSTFLDEGDKENRPSATENAGANASRKFKFDLSELRDALEKSSEAIAKIQREKDGRQIQ